MTVKELITILKAYKNQDHLVIMSSDPEGNSCSPIQDADAVMYDHEKKEIYSSDEVEEYCPDAKPVVCLWPR